MKSKTTKDKSKTYEKDKKKKPSKVSINENEKNSSYEEFRVEKLDFLSESDDDIETKMKKMITLKKMGGSLEEFNQNELNKIQFKKQSILSPKGLNSKNNQQQKENNLMKIKNGLNNFMNFFSLIKRKIKVSVFNDLKSYYKKSKTLKAKKKKEKSSKKIKKEKISKEETKDNVKNPVFKTKFYEEKNINKLIEAILKLLLKDKKIFLKSLTPVRRETKRKTIKLTTTVTKKSYVDRKKHLEREGNGRRNSITPNKNKFEIFKEIEEEEISYDLDESNQEDTFIQQDKLEDIEKDKVDKSQLVEYDAFYKEQFFKNEVFNYDVRDIKDKEVEEINHEMNKLEAHRKLLEKRKEKDAQEKKGLNTTELKKEIEKLEKEYIKAKTKEKPKLNLIMNNTEGLLYKGRLLSFYFNGVKNVDFPRFSMESSKESGAREIIDFKVLRKEEKARRYFDYYCCLEQRHKIYRVLVNVRFWCRFLVNNWIFDNISLLFIVTNTILILISDPTDPNNIGNLSDNYFLIFYTLEAILKIVTFSFISAEDAYIKDYWNMLDFFVVLVGWISFIIEKVMNGTKITGLAGLRAFRILRPLKTIKRFKDLKKLVTALLASISHLGETTIVLIFFFLIFAIGGRQMWMGNFYRRCMSVNYGYMYSTQESTMMCSFDTDCEELNSYGIKYICAKGYINPDSGAINFDDTLGAFVTIFVMSTLEGWTNVFTYVSKTFKDKIFINPIIVFLFFHVFIILGAFYLINLFLAVTNSEFEKIEADRKLLSEKKNFFKLIKETFDPKEKLKKEKKQKNKKKKEDNNMKSDQALLDLYYKVKDEAYQITKNKRDIPVLYSTVKDIYIMSNTDPEELYLEEKRIDEEDTFLSKDIKRQQKEIDALIDLKRKEMKNEQNNEGNAMKKTYTEYTRKKTNKSDKTVKTSKSLGSSNSRLGKVSSRRNVFLKKKETTRGNVLKLLDKINKDLIKESIDNTLKQIEERTKDLYHIIKSDNNNLEDEKNELRRKLRKKAKKKEDKIKIKLEEDLPFEKEEREKKEKREKEMKLMEEKRKKEMKLNKFKNQISKRILKKYQRKKIEEINQEQIGEELSFLSDLSLSDMDRSFNQLRRVNSFHEEQKKRIDLIDKNYSIVDKNDIIKKEEKLIEYEDEEYIENVDFMRPKNILASIIKLKNDEEIQTKLNKLRNQFNINSFLKKQAKKGNNIKNVGRRKSFLNFLEYVNKPEDFEEYIKNKDNELTFRKREDNDEKQNIITPVYEEKKVTENNQESSSSSLFDEKSSESIIYRNNDNLSLMKPSKESNQAMNTINSNTSFLSKASHISIDQNVSVGDIDLIPQEIKEPVDLFTHELQKGNLDKNIKGNKYTQLLRKSTFDRNFVNINLNITSQGQSKFYRNVNRVLNNNLYSDKIVPRGRKAGGLDVSHIEREKNYGEILTKAEPNLILSESNDINISINNPNNISESVENINARNFKKRTTMDSSKNIQLNERQLGLNNTKNSLRFSSDNHKEEAKKIKKKNTILFKAKSIEKNLDKYPVENTNKFLIKEINRPYTDPLTIKQESITDNLRGTKYYMNYLYNIFDKDLKVKDTFVIDKWTNEILAKKDKFIKKKPLPESVEAFYVFNDKKLNLKKYKYLFHKDFEFRDEECAFLSHNLKYLPKSVLEIMPLRLRNFGNFVDKKETNLGTLGIKPDAMNISNIDKKQTTKTNTRSGRTFSMSFKNKSRIITSSAFTDHYKTYEQIKYKKGLLEKVYKRINELNYRTLSSYFTNEQKIYTEFIDEKRRQEAIEEIEKRNNEKQNKLEVRGEITKIEIYDLKTNSRRYILWSGADVLSNKNEEENRKKWNNIIKALEDFNMIIWTQNPAMQRLQKIRYAFYILAINDYFDYFILLVVLVNSVFMALDGNIFKPEIINNLNISNYIFNSIFFLEYIVKFIGLSPLVYYSDGFTYLDTIIIAFAILDMIMPSEIDDEQLGSKKSVSSQLSFLRVFRIFRVIRLTKILRRLKSMRLIIVSMKKALVSVSYIVCILIMFILIFELLGMSLLSGNMHYQKFVEGFYTTYQILTLENWNSLLYELWPMNSLCFIYFVVWIFLGNYIIFNLFTSVLLQSFGKDDETDVDDLNEDELVENMYPLPDYLYSIKKAEKEHKQLSSKDLIRYTQRQTDEDLDNIKDLDNEEEQNKPKSESKSLNKIKVSNTAKSASMFTSAIISRNSGSIIVDDDDSSASSEKNYTGNIVEKQMKEWAKVNKLFKKNECERSMYILPQTNKFRIFCLKLMTNKWFDRFILLMILLSTVRLILDTIISGYVSVLVFEVVDAFFNLIFFLEALIKICALGFVLDEGSYLRDNWNKIDIIIVLCSIFDYVNLFQKYFVDDKSTSSLQFLTVLRVLRTLRPLRFISHNSQLKLIIISLFDSFLPILNALLIVLVVYYIFSIVGISLFYDDFHNCYFMNLDGTFSLAVDSFESEMADAGISNDKDSMSNFCSNKFNGIMDTGPAFKFSNIFTSIITSYVLSTQEGWPDIMNSYRIYGDVNGIFFIVYNLILAYFFLNLFTGIMFRYFNEAYSKEKTFAKDDKKAPKYYDFLTQIDKAQSNYSIWVRPEKGSIRYYLREFADSSFLDNFIMGCIVLNMITMALNYDTSDPKYDLALTYVNYIFTGIFIVECIIKLLAYGISYFHSGWNRFDFFAVVASIADLVIQNIDGIDAKFLKSFQIIRVLRVLRVTRVLRLVKSLKGLEKLIQTLTWSIGALANVFMLMLIIFCIFAILGCYFYDGITYKKYRSSFKYINEFYNLDNFYNSFLLTFRCTTGENWPNIMMELAFVEREVSEVYAYVYMILSNFINSIIMLNLFLMVTLQQYDEFTGKNYNPIEKFESFLTEFNNSWNKFSTPEDKGIRIKQGSVILFFMDFNWKKLNFPEKGKLEHIKKFVANLKLRIDNENNVYYLDVIFKVLVNTMGMQIERNNPDNSLIIRTEKKIQDEINEVINAYMKKEKKEKNKNIITFNPLTTHIYFKMTYQYMKTFIKAYKENQMNLSLYNDEVEKESNEEENEENEEEVEDEKKSNKEKQN